MFLVFRQDYTVSLYRLPKKSFVLVYRSRVLADTAEGNLMLKFYSRALDIMVEIVQTPLWNQHG